MRTGKGIIQELGLLLATICVSFGAQAVEPPAGTITDLDNVGLFDGSANLLTSCVALQDPNGAALLDTNGQPRRYEVTLSLTRATLVFKVTGTAAWNPAKACSGVYRNGVYTDAVLITNLSSAYNGRVWNLTLDVLNANLEFKLRIDSSFSAVRTFGANTTALGSELGDFQSSATREFGTTNLPALITFRLPQCSDPQGDETRVVVVKDGVVISTNGVPGENYGWNTSGATTGEHRFQTYCSDEVGIRQLAAAKGLTFANSYIAVSATAPGTLTLRISQGSTPTTGEITFNFGASTSASDQALIREAALFARDFFTTTFGRTLQRNTTISTLGQSGGCANGGAAAFTGPQTMTICTSNQGWTVHGPVNKRKVIIHEIFHLLQFEVRWIGGAATSPHWLIEGAAEYVGWLGVSAQGHVTLDTARGCMLKEVADFAPGLQNLSAYETQQSFNVPGPLYPLAMIGTDQLVAGSSAAALLTFGTALGNGTALATSFQTAFGRTSTDFYTQFPAYRTGLAVPSTYLCRI